MAPVVGGAGEDGLELHVNDLLSLVVEWGGSDLHLTSGSPPVIRVHGELRTVPGQAVLNGSEVRRLVFAMLTKRQREKFEAELELDTSYALPGVGRFRVNVFLQRDSVGCVMRVIPYEIVPFDSLGVPPGRTFLKVVLPLMVPELVPDFRRRRSRRPSPLPAPRGSAAAGCGSCSRSRR